MTNEELDELKTLLAKATPEPWNIGYEGHVMADKKLIAGCMGHQDNFTPNLRETNTANAELIAAIRNAAPALIASARRYAKLRETLEQIAEDSEQCAKQDGMPIGDNRAWKSVGRIARKALETK